MEANQVFFVDEDDVSRGGIMINDMIICGCCGGIFKVDEVERWEVLPWVDIDDIIKG